MRPRTWSAALLLSIGCAANAVAEDWQYWSTWSAVHDISDRAQVSAMAEVYLRDSASDDYVYDEYITYARRLGQGFGLLGQAYFESAQSPNDGWSATRSAVVGPSYTKDIPHVCSVRLEDRVFYRINSPSGWDYHRPRLYLSRDVGQIKFTLSDEMRVDLGGERADGFYRNRIYAMASTKVSESLTLGLGYLRQSDKVNGVWESFNGVQSLVTATF